MVKKRIALLVLFLLSALAAQPLPSVRNFGQVDAHLYRSAQPDAHGLLELARFGIRTVVDLNTGDRSGERAEVEALGMRYVHVPMSGWPSLGLGRPSSHQIAAALEAIGDSSGPVLIHCTHGEDRTGTTVAVYRIERGWTAAQVYAEARFYHINPLQWGMRRFIRRGCR